MSGDITTIVLHLGFNFAPTTAHIGGNWGNEGGFSYNVFDSGMIESFYQWAGNDPLTYSAIPDGWAYQTNPTDPRFNKYFGSAVATTLTFNLVPLIWAGLRPGKIRSPLVYDGDGGAYVTGMDVYDATGVKLNLDPENAEILTFPSGPSGFWTSYISCQES